MTDYRQFLTDDGYLILLLHGVISRQRHEIRNYTSKHIPLDHFVGVLRELRDAGGVAVSLDDIVTATRTGTSLPPRAFAVTFDDGFENNYSIAAPALRDLGVPATFYVTTGFIESDCSSWTDLIEYAVEAVPVVSLSMGIDGIDGTYSRNEDKILLLDAVRSHVKANATIDPYDFAMQVWSLLGVETMEPDPELDRKLSWEQVREMAADTQFIIGGHSHTHRILEFLSEQELARELDLSIELLGRHLRAPVEHYSYPEGLAHCYSKRVIEALQNRGVACAPSAIEGINQVGDDLFELRRITVT